MLRCHCDPLSCPNRRDAYRSRILFCLPPSLGSSSSETRLRLGMTRPALRAPLPRGDLYLSVASNNSPLLSRVPDGRGGFDPPWETLQFHPAKTRRHWIHARLRPLRGALLQCFGSRGSALLHPWLHASASPRRWAFEYSASRTFRAAASPARVRWSRKQAKHIRDEINDHLTDRNPVNC